MTADFWNDRYAGEAYAYGETPNVFFAGTLPALGPPGRLLLPAEGEGRNAVHAARGGWAVTAYDPSEVGRDKALRLAARHGVSIDYQVADHEGAVLEPEAFRAVAFVFAHAPPPVRRFAHRRAVDALAPGGHVLVEAYGKDQLRHGTGGPPNEALLFSADDLREDFAALEILRLEEVETEIREGAYHDGLAAVVRLVARKP